MVLPKFSRHNRDKVVLCLFAKLLLRECFRIPKPFLDFFVSAKSIRDRRLLLLMPSDDSSKDVY